MFVIALEMHAPILLATPLSKQVPKPCPCSRHPMWTYQAPCLARCLIIVKCLSAADLACSNHRQALTIAGSLSVKQSRQMLHASGSISCMPCIHVAGGRQGMRSAFLRAADVSIVPVPGHVRGGTSSHSMKPTTLRYGCLRPARHFLLIRTA